MDSLVFDLCRGPGTVAQVVCSRSRASIERISKQQKKTLINLTKTTHAKEMLFY
jgi:hypothetical protein